MRKRWIGIVGGLVLAAGSLVAMAPLTYAVSGMIAGSTAASASALLASHGNVVNAKNSNFCVGIAGNGNAGSWSCTTNADQVWHWDATSSVNPSYRRLQNAQGKCLGVAGGNTNQGAQVVGFSCLTHDDQYWFFDSNSGSGHLWNLNSGLVLAVLGGNVQNGTPLVIWADGGQADQLWFGRNTP